jgi:hypothetical protein
VPRTAEAQQGGDEASQRFRAGVAFYKSKNYPAALVEFKVPTSSRRTPRAPQPARRRGS